MTDDNEYDIAIVGMAGCFPGAKNIGEFWQNLVSGRESISVLSDDEIEKSGINPAVLDDPNYVKAAPVLDGHDRFDAEFFGYPPREAQSMDPQHRLFLECAWKALEHAGYSSDLYDGRIGVFGGAAMNTYLLFSGLLPKFVSEYLPTLIGNDNSFLSTRVSYKMNLSGPSITLQTACSTSLVAVHTACQSLLNEECDMALAGGVSVRVPHYNGHFYQEGSVFTPDGHCRAFDAKARGTIFGSGAGVIVLQPLADAIADGSTIYAVIKGSAINNDGSSKADYTAPSVNSQSEAIVEALANSGIEADTVSYIEAHGTGTYLGDPIEVAALTKAFRIYTEKKGFCGIGSVKTNVGHLDAAAGIAGLIKTVLSLKNEMIPPSLHFEKPNPEIDFDNSPFYVNSTLKEWKSPDTPRRAGVSSLGIGGTNAHVILEEAPLVENSKKRKSRSANLLLLSAKTSTALDAATVNIAEYLKQNQELNLADVAYTLQMGRKVFNHRRILVAENIDKAIEALENSDPLRVLTSYQEPLNREITFMFPGQGSQYVKMSQELYKTEPEFRDHIDRCSEILKPIMGLDIREILYADEESAAAATEKLKNTLITQPALFTIEYSLAKLWMSWGVLPAALVGHSIGEYTAACLAGVFELEDALALVAERGRLMQELPAGSMLAVTMSESELLNHLNGKLSLSAVNSPSLCVVSGEKEAVAEFENQMKEKNAACQLLHTSHAFHSAMMEPIIEPFIDKVKRVSLSPPQIPVISTVTGKWVEPGEMTNPDYWARNLRQTVRFSDCADELLNNSDRVFLEVGPGKTLITLVKQHGSKAREHVAVPSLRHPKEQRSDIAFILESMGQLWLAGAQVNWSELYVNEKRHRIPLPTYPFERQRYWASPQSNSGSTGGMNYLETQSAHALPGYKNDIEDWFYVPLWKPSLAPFIPDGPMDSSQVLMFVDENGLGNKLAKGLEQMSMHIVTVKAGNAFAKHSDRAYTINPQSSEDYSSLFKDLSEKGDVPTNIVHLWNVTLEDCQVGLSELEAFQDKGLYSLMYIAQALGHEDFPGTLRIEVITNGLYEIRGDEVLHPFKATLLGPCKVIPLEYSNIICRNIDIEFSESLSIKEKLIDQLSADLMSDNNDAVVAYRGSNRFTQTVEPVKMDKTRESNSKLKEEGVYLITGGLGGIGLALAEYLAGAVRARLVLVGRSALPERDEWGQWLESHDPEDAVSKKIGKLLKIEELGGKVLTVSADITDHSRMKNVVEQAERLFGNINGVIHSAGTIDQGGVIQRRTREMMENAVDSKVKGTMVINSVLDHAKLDFFVLCSSIASDIYHSRVGESGYVAANSYLDAFAGYRNKKDGTYTVAINWDAWKEVGMSVNAAEQFSRTHNIKSPELFNALDALSPEEGVVIFRRVLNSSFPRVLVSTRDLRLRIEHDVNSKSHFLEAPEEADTDRPLHSRPALAQDYVAPESEMEKTVAHIWQQLLGIENVGINDDYFALGGTSLGATQILSRIREAYQVEMQIQQIFASPTIAGIVKIIEGLKWAVKSTADAVDQEGEDMIEGEL